VSIGASAARIGESTSSRSAPEGMTLNVRVPDQVISCGTAPRTPWPIVLMARTLDLGGSERQLAEVAIALDRSLFAPVVVCFDSRGIRGDDLRRAQVPVIEIPVRSLTATRTIALSWQFARWLRRRRAVIVHPFDVPTALFGVPLARLARVPVVLSSQRGDRGLFSRPLQHALRCTDHLVDGVVVNSEYIRGLLLARHGVPDRLIHTCRNGIDVSRFNPEGRVRRPELRKGGCVIGIVAVLRPEKSLETLVAAFARLADQRHQLVIVGDGPSRSGLEPLAAALGVADRVIFVPATPDVAPWYRSIDVFVLPSVNESFSNSLMEAMACGCTVVASNVGGNPELVRHGETGLLFESGDAADLAHRLERVLSDAEYRHALAAAATRTIQTNYTNELAARRIGALYRKLWVSRLR
jgi:glycosyltransferase involved in cell wall biosynthesis